jgi:hypothetical protein
MGKKLKKLYNVDRDPLMENLSSSLSLEAAKFCWIFFKNGKFAFLHPPPPQNGWLIGITAGQHVWRIVKEAGFMCPHTRKLNQDLLENIFGAICLYSGSNNNPSVGQFEDALKTSIINGLAFRGLCGSNCEGDDANLLDNLQSSFKAPDASSPNPSTSHGKETPDVVPDSFHVAQ